MNYTQNQKIEQVTESTLVLGVDIGSSEHYVRAFDYRGRELTRKVFRFSTDINGFNSFYDWVTQICIKHGKNEAMIGCEPTSPWIRRCMTVSERISRFTSASAFFCALVSVLLFLLLLLLHQLLHQLIL